MGIPGWAATPTKGAADLAPTTNDSASVFPSRLTQRLLGASQSWGWGEDSGTPRTGEPQLLTWELWTPSRGNVSGSRSGDFSAQRARCAAHSLRYVQETSVLEGFFLGFRLFQICVLPL